MDIVTLFCLADDFCQAFIPKWHKLLIASGSKKRQRPNQLTVSEIITILLLFQQSHYRDFKTFYLQYVQPYLKPAFPKLLSYKRFVALMPTVLVPLCALLQSLKATSDGLAFIDSTPIAVCHNKRIQSHKVFKAFAALGKTTNGWFYGFKLHLIINHKGELCNCCITPGNVDDRAPVQDLTKAMLGKLFADKGYIDHKLFEQLLERGLQLITGIRKNMKNRLMSLWDKVILRKRSLIESTNHLLKNVFQLAHTRHRSVYNGFVNMVCALIAYALHPRKPSLA